MPVNYRANIHVLREKKVYYTGTAELLEGYALCYDSDATTDVLGLTVAEGSQPPGRYLMVEQPGAANMGRFAGVVAAESNAITGPAWVVIYVPNGAAIPVYTDLSTTLDETLLAINPSSWKFSAPVYGGSATSSRTVAYAGETKDRSTDNGLVLAYVDPNVYLSQGQGALSNYRTITSTSDCMPNIISIQKRGATGDFSAVRIRGMIGGDAAAAGSGVMGSALRVEGGIASTTISEADHILALSACAEMKTGTSTTSTVLTATKILCGALIKAEAMGTSYSTISGHVYGIWIAGQIDSAVGGDWAMMYFEEATAGAITPDYWFKSNTGDAVALVTATNVTIDHALKVRIGGTTYYVGLYDAQTGN